MMAISCDFLFHSGPQTLSFESQALTPTTLIERYSSEIYAFARIQFNLFSNQIVHTTRNIQMTLILKISGQVYLYLQIKDRFVLCNIDSQTKTQRKTNEIN